ncbi:HNH endonuclease [Streptomyces phage Annadreamy]|uniref:HNH endonuclease n=2 Tax=Annadreamyvirus annadreamy TaxID=2846392 RepID=A0A345GTD4_9CAUD|nr:HNH endonuclease [Streptomyces phage Annadreamy]AXG66206.1 HNH endonuclease [Streptomyces phage Annadreamy]QGH79420.1 HNH endonuclease [Streptomyces phage Limpid]
MNDIMTREEIILALEARDGLNCFLCKEPFSKDVNSPLFEVTIDHWYPQSIAFAEGWTYDEVNAISNLRKAHRPCNANKGDLVPNPDGTLPQRPVKERTIRLPRPVSCDTCMNGRILLLGEICPDCSSGPQPRAFPKTLQKTPKECDHSSYHCWMCVIGHIPRKSALQTIITG